MRDKDSLETALQRQECIQETSSFKRGHTINFSVEYGEYDALPADVLGLIAEYDGTLYDSGPTEYDYTVVV